MYLIRNYFELFDLAPDYSLDMTALADSYRRLKHHHRPVRVRGAHDREVAQAEDSVAFVDRAYQTLKSPVARGAYLLELRDIDPEGETGIARDGVFLMNRMQLLEGLEEAEDALKPAAVLAGLEQEAEGRLADLEADFATALASDDSQGAVEVLARMRFYDSFLGQIQAFEEERDL